MGTTTLTPTDRRTREAVVHALDWDPGIDDSAVGVAVSNSVVTLTGYIDSCAGKLEAERAAKRVRGVRAVANDLVVRLTVEQTDSDLARDVARALDLHAEVPTTVQAGVHNGHVTLTGAVNWNGQKRSAENAVRRIRGVRGVFNHIIVAPDRLNRDLRHRIVEALHRNADLDARHIAVDIRGDVAVLTGSVASWFQGEAAARAVAGAPGIRAVDNRIAVHLPESDEPATR
jgi:osmotically-inducible protein OsmY